MWPNLVPRSPTAKGKGDLVKFDNMANEFFFFAGQLALVMLVFILMSYFYKYVYYSANGVVSEDVPLQEAQDETEEKKQTDKN